MPHVKSLTPLRAMAAALVIAASGPAHAQLGATVVIAATGIASSSNLADAAASVLHQATNNAVRWQESADANQIRVRQYVSSSGQVYAVSWDGPAMPDVAVLLGTWFDRYRQEASAALPNASGLHSSRVSSSDLMVETAVRLRDFSGRAWLPNALPAGVTAADIE
ncbi:hypothetical protein AWB69_08146 [Caballeronia udeis]|uniref:DUF2844 domain-containing protein n=1 Tax=Caballeronia udeis TaxID=1232866 RepID=A0A158JKV8_9BURK|nr:DUF2844 domain-containing protein [Caballeronia udeis]SAL69103.1 hypothetical protein AWB69_08146 [Caballeronia udeis]